MPKLSPDQRTDVITAALGLQYGNDYGRKFYGDANYDVLNYALREYPNVESLAELELSVRATNCLESENISSVRDLVSRAEDELLEVRNFGETTLKEVRQKLAEHGLQLGMRLPAARR